MSGSVRPPAAVMIDRPDSTDRDDAIWVAPDGRGWHARVHVADVARVVPWGGAVDMAACRRGRTLYLPDRTVTMLPPAEQAAAALTPGRPVSTCAITLSVDRAGALVDVDVAAAELTAPVAISYAQAAQALWDPEDPLHGMLRAAYGLAQALLSGRRAAGALAAYDLRRGWATDEDGRIVALVGPERNPGYLIVQELMIAANRAAAQWALDRDLPLLFRNHCAGNASRQELTGQLAVAGDADPAEDFAVPGAHAGNRCGSGCWPGCRPSRRTR